MEILRSISYFLLAGIFEIGGGYLIWLWLREGKSVLLGLLGAAILLLYSVVPTWQPANFGRVYAAYGGIFVVLSIFWGMWVDQVSVDRWDLWGGLLCLAGVGLIMWGPRG